MTVKRTNNRRSSSHLERPDDAEVTRAAGPPPQRPVAVDEDPEDVKRRQAAFDSDFYWREEKLHGFSISRDALFGQLRLAMGAPPLSVCLADTEAFQADAQRILFLCSHTPAQWNRLRVDMAILQTAIDEWAEANISSAEKLEAETIAMKIWIAAQENRHEPAPVTTSNSDDLGN